MKTTIKKQPPAYCFAGNPILFEFETDSQEPVVIDFTIGTDTHSYSYLPFGSKAPYSLRFLAEDLIRDYFADISIPEGQIIAALEDFTLDCKLQATGLDSEISFTVFPGGIPNRTLAELALSGRDMFSYRLTVPTRLFLLTTRTNSHHLFMRETEIYPFVFIGQGKPLRLTSAGVKTIITDTPAEGKIYVLDFNAVRRTFFNRYNEIPSHISVGIDAHYSFDVTFTPNSLSDETYLLKFRNSLGAYEIVEVSGKAELTPEYEEESLWQKKTEHEFYEEQRSRIVTQDIYEVESGYKSREELDFILDMLCSDEIYILQGNYWNRCHLTTEKSSIPRRMTTPGSIPLKIRMGTKELFRSPALDFTTPQSPSLVNLTRPGYPEWNGNGLFFTDLTLLYNE